MANLKGLLTGASLFCFIAHGECVPAAARSPEALAQFLKQANSQAAVNILDLSVSQAGQAIPIYICLGYEEKRKNLGQRPLLQPVEPPGPFIRSTQFFVRINRKLKTRITLSWESIRSSSQASVRLEPIQTLYIYFTSGQDTYEKMQSPNGCYSIDVDPQTHPRKVKLEFLSGNERHVLELIFMDFKKPYTLVSNHDHISN